MKKYIGDKAFYGKVLMISVPIIIQNAITNFVGLLDNLMVGQTGTNQMNGVAIVNQLLFVFNLCVWGAVSGAGIFTAQYYGNGDEEGVRNTFRAKIVLLFVVLVLGNVLFLTGGDWLIGCFLHETDGVGDVAATLSAGHSYMNIMLIGLIPFCFSQAYANTLRDIGETTTPMVSGIAAVFINVFLNWVLIFGNLGAPELGVEGAAIATVISRFVETFIVVFWVHSHKARYAFIKGAYKSIRIPAKLMEQILIKGAPLALNEGIWAMGVTVLNQNYSQRGLSVVAALNISSTITNLFSVVYMAIGETIAIIVGQLLGAGRMEDAKDTDRKMIFFSVSCGIAVGIIMSFCSGAFPMLYKTEPQVQRLASVFILVAAFMMPFNAFLHASYFTLRTGGKTIITFVFDSCFEWLLIVPCAFILARYTQMPIIWMYICISSLDFLKCILGFILVKKGIWLNNIVKDI